MASTVNPRPYDSSRRQAQARATRRAVLAAARQLFLEHRYAGTTLPMVAEAAGVSVQTVYKLFANKPGLVKAVFDVAIVGDDEPVPLMQREFVQRNITEPDPRKKLIHYGRHVADVAPRISPILLVVRDAAATDASAGELWATLQQERLTGMTAFAKHLHEGGHLRKGMTVGHARDVLWAHNSVELWDLLVNQRGWKLSKFGEWIGNQLVAALL